ncbi:hypothetical protein MRX96_015951 [Rhipicephalus microplus]
MLAFIYANGDLTYQADLARILTAPLCSFPQSSLKAGEQSLRRNVSRRRRPSAGHHRVVHPSGSALHPHPRGMTPPLSSEEERGRSEKEGEPRPPRPLPAAGEEASGRPPRAGPVVW